MTSDLLPIIQTERLRLRAFELDDAAALSRNMTPGVTRWLASWPDPVTEAYAIARIDREELTGFFEVRRPEGV